MTQQLKGTDQLMKFLDQLPDKVQNNVARNGMRAGAVVLRDILRQKLPVRKGFLKKSVRITTKAKQRGVVRAAVTVGGGKAWYAGIYEFGAKPHRIAAEGKALVIEDGVLRKSAQSPGFAGKGTIRACADESIKPASDAVVDRVRSLLRDKHGLDVPAQEDEGGDGS